jgi:uncharacterized protein YaiE (UPF0345 family)
MFRTNTRTASLLGTLLLTLVATACDSDTLAIEDGEKALVRVLLTDAPADYIGSAWVDIGRVELVPSGDGPHVVLSEDGTDGLVNLLDLQGAATMPIAEAEIDPGSFKQIRLIIEAARVSLAGEYTFSDGEPEMELTVPSGAQTGIKLNLSSEDDPSGVEIVPGETVLVLDFDVSQSYVLRGNPTTPAGVHGVNFKPTIRVAAYDVAASISGVVTPGEEGVPVGGRTVVAEPTDGGTVEGYQTRSGTATTAEDGSYTIHYLVPGSYEVSLELPPGFTSDPESRMAMLDHSENETGADFEIFDRTGTISGTVTGVSIEGLTVTATPAADGAEALMATTAADGTYTIESVPAGMYTVTVAVAEGLATVPASVDVDLMAEEERMGVNFEVVAPEQ